MHTKQIIEFINNHFRRISSGKTFIENIVIPMLALMLYSFSFQIISSMYFPKGVNSVFAGRLWKYVMLLLVILLILFFLTKLLRRKIVGHSQSSHEKITNGDLLLILLPLTPIVQYVFNNQDLLSVKDSIIILAIFLVISAIYTIIIPFLLSPLSPGRTLKFVGLAFIFTILSMPLLSQYFSWFEKGSLKIQLLFLVATFLITYILYQKRSKPYLLAFIVAFFVINSASNVILNYSIRNISTPSTHDTDITSAVSNKVPTTTPDIYLLLYDAYVCNETMLAYGIDNSKQEKYLEDLGFILYPHTYSIGSQSIETMSLVLNASTEYYGDWRRAVSGDGVVHGILKKLGYKTYGVFTNSYFVHKVGSSYDYTLPEYYYDTPSFLPVITAILVGEFRFEFTLSHEDGQYRDLTHEQFIQTKRNIFSKSYGKSVFLYTHVGLPNHSQNSGKCLSNETELYKERLEEANNEMKEDIEVIMKNHPHSLIIIAGDHGPYLTKNCFSTSRKYDSSEITRLDIQDRYGTFLAIKWPTNDFSFYDDIIVLQDVFPAVLAYIYNDISILESKIDPISRSEVTSGVFVDNGIIVGGVNDKEPLFVYQKYPSE